MFENYQSREIIPQFRGRTASYSHSFNVKRKRITVVLTCKFHSRTDEKMRSEQEMSA